MHSFFLCPGGGMADAADLKSASHKEYGFDPRPGYQLSFYEKRKLDKEKRRIAFFKKAWQKLRRFIMDRWSFFVLCGMGGSAPLPPGRCWQDGWGALPPCS